MLDLTTDQRSALASGEPVPFVVDQTDCIVLRRDVFDRMRRVAYDDGPWTAGEMSTLAEHAFDDADTAGPIT